MKTSFKKLLDNTRLTIPILQRDYAQGRTDDKTNRIRKDFLDTVFDVIKKRSADLSSNQALELDFIYGFSKDDKPVTNFTPIDGQQRLTTLWLLWWIVAAKETVNDIAFLHNFQYETRHSTTVFCQKLLAFNPSFKSQSISEEIKNQPWYFETWDYDSGIRAMLVMLDDLEVRYDRLNVKPIWDTLNHQNSPFYFYKLDMEKVGLPDDLYIKMNSRGKALTDFEYFKTNFSEVINDESLKSRFRKSIDKEWSDVIWQIVSNSRKRDKDADLAIEVDTCFMRLISFITDVLGYKEGVSINDISSASKELKQVYRNADNLLFLFNILDCIVDLQKKDDAFWKDLFYIDAADFNKKKSRLFFQNGQVNLLEKCIFAYAKNSREFSYPEQLLLYSCMIQWLSNTDDFHRAARVIRNLVANSSNELRVESIDKNIREIESFIVHRNYDVLATFKSDQIKEERDKQNALNRSPHLEFHICELEDSDLLRGCISIFDFEDEKFVERKIVFLSLFKEDIIQSDFKNRANLLLCFGDYTQDDGDYTNMLANSKGNWRTYFTTPAFNKAQLVSKTKPTLMKCLDYFVTHPDKTVHDKIEETLKIYEEGEKDWRFYFIKYTGFRDQCNKGYFVWEDNHYPSFKMNQKYFHGYHWDPFLLEAKKIINSDAIEYPYGNRMQLISGDKIYDIRTTSEGFTICDSTLTTEELQHVVKQVNIKQSENGLDLEDMIEILVAELKLMMGTTG